MNKDIRKLVLSALFAALSCIMTMVIQIPAPTGYVNLGDCAVLLGAWILGPWWGAAAGGIGSMMADILSGWASYAPATFVIKFLMGVTAALVFRWMSQRKYAQWGMAAGALVAELIMVVGYFSYEGVVLGVGAAAAASVPANMVQGLVCMVAAIAVSALMERSGVAKRIR